VFKSSSGVQNYSMVNWRKVRMWFILLLFFAVTFSHAQEPKLFSADPAVFPYELEGFLKQASDKEIRLAFSGFSYLWTAGLFTTDVQQKIIATCNLMLGQRMRPTPAFRDYLISINSFPDVADSHSLLAWHKGLEPFIDSKRLRQLSEFQDATVLVNKNHILFKSYSNSWRFRGGSYSFVYDSVLSVRLKDVDLTCISGRDSINIYKTNGFSPFLMNKLLADGGTVYWNAIGFEKTKVYALLNRYEINLKQTGYTADTVNFYNKDFFSYPLAGRLENRVLAGVPADKATFPKFVSYQTDITINQVFKDIDYRGGFSLEGPRVIGSGYGDQDAMLWINRNGSPFIRLYSRSFVIHTDRLVSQRAAAVIFLDSDSIFHPGLQLRYIDENKELSLVRSGDAVSSGPYHDSYHKVEMYVEALFYKMGADSITMEMIKGINRTGKALFESANFYSEERFNKLEGIDEINPINLIYNYTQYTNRKTFYIYELAEYLRKPPEQVKVLILNLANGGFVTYNIDNEKVAVLPRLYDYLKARSKKIDYDVIQIRSEVSRSSNAVLNLKTYDLKILGVSEVSLSDSQAVFIYPKDKQIILQKNRDFIFTGLVKAGYFNFYANQCSFDYTRFKLDLPQVDSLTFRVDVPDPKTKKIGQVDVKSAIANLSGELLIDDPANKSGLQVLPVYPVFISKNDAFVYYNKAETASGAYNKDSFYYNVYPFRLDSLNSFTTTGLKFDGYLSSGNIMPDIKEPLRVMDDYSLGFTKSLPAEGIPVYNAKGVCYSDLKLSNAGLQGKGSLTFMASESKSDDFRFYPDSLVADLTEFSMSEQAGPPSYPQVYAKGVHQYWLPELDVMRLSTLPGKEFAMYSGKVFHSGKLSLTSAGLLGNGSSRLDNADIASSTFVFRNQSFNSDTTDFRLYYPERPTVSLTTRIYPGRVDFKNQIANFGTPGKSVKIDLPLSRYICYMDKIEWRMAGSELRLTNSLAQRAALTDTANLRSLVDFDFSGSEFMSTDPERDSLQFFAMEANYAMKENRINAREVKMIRVADAAVFPGDGRITIKSDGDMELLKGATIIASRKNKYYRIYNAGVKVDSRKDYTASGYYDYVDEEGNVTPLYFDPIRVDTSMQTTATARVHDKAGMPLNAHFLFTGDVELRANNPYLNFKGGYRLTGPCIAETAPWVAFNAEINPADVHLPVILPMKDTLGNPVLASIVYSDFFGSIYPSIFEKPKAYGDTAVIAAAGSIRYYNPTGSFMIGSDSRLNLETKSGNFLNFDTRQCILTGEGNIALGVGLGQIGLGAFGKATQFTVIDSTSLSLGIILDFVFSDQAMAKMKEVLQLSDLRGADVNSETTLILLNNVLGAAGTAEFLNEINTTGQIKRMPPQLDKTMVISDITMIWNPDLKSYISKGPFSITSLYKDVINRQVDGYIEIGKRRTGDILNIYIDAGPQEWYFFTYGNGILQAISSNTAFNDILAGVKESKRVVRGASEEEGYQYIISTPERRIAFLRKMQSISDN